MAGRPQTPQPHGKGFRIRGLDGQYAKYATYDEAEGAAVQIARARRAEAGVPKLARKRKTTSPTAPTMAEWRAGWAPRRKVTMRTAETQDGYWRKYVQPAFGDRELVVVTPDETDDWRYEIDLWLEELEADGVSPDNRYGARAQLSAIFTGAVADRDVSVRFNPVHGTRVPERLTRSIRSATAHEVELLLKATPEHYRLMFRFIAETGLRISEAIGLTVDNLRLTGSAPYVIVRQVGERDGSVRRSTKRRGTETSRNVVLTEELAAALSALVAGRKRTARVFTTEAGAPLDYANLRRRVFDVAVDEAGLAADGDRLTAHDLRHFACTSWIEAGVPLPTVQYLMGHSDLKTTQRYAHSTDAGMAAARAARAS